MLRSSIRVTDTARLGILPINPDKAKEFIVEDAANRVLHEGRSLMTRLAASHWGFINNNGYWYDPKTVDGSIPTWVEPYKKPVLPYHPGDDEKDVSVLGRIQAASYTKGVARAFIQDDVIPDNEPDGHIDLLTKISAEDAIQKILDKRYDTVSISALATNVTCSICGEGIALKDSKCTHQRFARYNEDGERDKNGKLCYYIAGPLAGRHVAFVITPSDVYAGVKDVEWEDAVTDEVMQTIMMELFIISDKEEFAVSLHGDSSENLFDQIQDSDKRTALFEMLSAGKDNDPKDDPTVTDVNVPSGAEDDEAASEDTSSEERSTMEEYTWLDLIVMTDEEVNEVFKKSPDKITEDAKLSTATRKKLPDSAFCGPGRSFPAHDAAHVRAGLRLLNKAKASSSTKAKILSCLRSRAKKYGIKAAATVKSSTGEEFALESIVCIDVMLVDATIEDILALDIVSEYIDKTFGTAGKAETDDPKPKDEEANATADENSGEEQTTPKTSGSGETTDDQNKIVVLERSLKERDEEISTLTAEGAGGLATLKASVVERILDMQLWLRKITKDEVETARKEYMERELASLDDKAKDLRKNVELGISNPTESVGSTQVDGDRDTDAIVDGNNSATTARDMRMRVLFPELDLDVEGR